MRTCYGSHNKYAPRKASHRIPRDHPETEFYKLLSYDENRQVVVSESPLVQQLNPAAWSCANCRHCREQQHKYI